MVVVLHLPDFDERGISEYPEKNLSQQRREPTTNSNHMICHRSRDSNPDCANWWEDQCSHHYATRYDGISRGGC